MTVASSAPAGLASRLFASGSLAFLLRMLPALFGVAVPIWAGALDLAEGQGGTIFAAYNGGAVLAVIAGTLGMPGLAMRPALAAVALGSLGLALSASWGLLLGGAFVAGTGYGVLAVAVNRRFLSDFGHRGPGMVSLVNGNYGLGAILSPLLFLLAGSAPRPSSGPPPRLPPSPWRLRGPSPSVRPPPACRPSAPAS